MFDIIRKLQNNKIVRKELRRYEPLMRLSIGDLYFRYGEPYNVLTVSGTTKDYIFRMFNGKDIILIVQVYTNMNDEIWQLKVRTTHRTDVNESINKYVMGGRINV